MGNSERESGLTDVEYAKVIFATTRVEEGNPEKICYRKIKGRNKRCNMYLSESLYSSGRQSQRQKNRRGKCSVTNVKERAKERQGC